MSIRLPLGWDVAMARNGLAPVVPPLGGGLFLCGSATPQTDIGYDSDPDILTLLTNCLADFKGAGAKRIWCADATYWGADLRAALEALGHTITIAADDTTLSASEYDFALLWQITNLVGATYIEKAAMVWDYLSHGGGAFLPMAYPQAYTHWNSTLLPHVGLTYSGQYVMGAGLHAYLIDTYDPLFDGVSTVWIKVSGGVGVRTPDYGSSVNLKATADGYGYRWFIFGIWRP